MNNRNDLKSEADVFARLGRDLASTSDAETAAKIILNAADSLIGWDACYLILYDPEKGGSPRPLLTIDTIDGKHVVLKGASPLKPSVNMLEAIEKGGFLSLYDGPFDVDDSLSFGDRRQRTLSQLFVSVVTGSRTIGVLSIQSYKRSAYKNEQLDLLNNLASHCAGALERIWAQEALGEFVERLKILHQAVNEINASLDGERVCQVVYETVEKVMPCNDFVIDGYDSTNNEVVPIYAVEYPHRRVYTNRYFADHGLAGEIIRTKRPIFLNNDKEIAESGIQFELYGSFEEDPTHSILAVPMILHGTIYGMVSAQSYQPNAYTEDDLYLLEVLASHAAIAIENARLFDSIQQLANTDPLTKTLNRRRFYELAEREFAEARKNQVPLSIIMLDVDDFKIFNDRYGHKIGDSVLTQIAEACKNALRVYDIFGRLGGEEFALALPNTHSEHALEVALRLNKLIAEKNFQEEFGMLDEEIQRVEQSLSVTVSVGVTTSDESCKNLDILMDRADRAMYLSKNLGRNRVHVWKRE
ncbi:MAG: diguanylate cyclase [Anaerolineales bacterium]|nr:diguanylate cyclase [Anaerolineales bacterium]